MNNMKKLFLALFVLVMTLGLTIESAEAARLGGGRSSGMQRQATPRPAPTPSRQATPQPAPVGAPAPAPQRSWLGPLAGLAAGIGLGALFSHLGMGAGMANIMTMLLIGMAVFFVFRLIARKMAPPRAEGQTQFAGVSPAENTPYTPPMAPLGGNTAGSVRDAAPNNPANIPADFDTEAFLRVAKLNFVRLQAANDEKNLADIREFVSPEMYAEIKLQMDERGNTPQKTDVVTLNAEFIELVTENAQYIASVRFSGMIREEANSAAVAFAEIWHLGKPIEGNRGWQICGIQQVSH